jgi:hypothetical protein
MITVCQTYPSPTLGPQPPPGGGILCFVPTLPITLCKVRCDTAPCSAVSCQTGVSLADFPGYIPANRGGAIRDPNKLLTILSITPIQNGNVTTGNSYPDCRGATVTDIKNCYTWSTRLTTGSRVLRYIVITNTPAPTSTPTLTPTPNPYWVKLKNTSFYTSRSLAQSIPASPIAYDADDDGSPYFIISSSGSDPGLVAASYINLGTASVSAKGWKTTEPQNPFTFTPSQFLAYLKARTALKTITDINNISSINSDTVVFNGNLTIDSTNISLFNSKKLVLLVSGNLNINVNFAPSSSSIALLSTGTITISPTVSQVNAILIGQNVDLGTTSDQGLKIIGNLVAIESLTNNRRWSTSSKPAVFVVFDKNLYLDLLPHLAVVKYSWRETQ